MSYIGIKKHFISVLFVFFLCIFLYPSKGKINWLEQEMPCSFFCDIAVIIPEEISSFPTNNKTKKDFFYQQEKEQEETPIEKNKGKCLGYLLQAFRIGGVAISIYFSAFFVSCFCRIRKTIALYDLYCRRLIALCYVSF